MSSRYSFLRKLGARETPAAPDEPESGARLAQGSQPSPIGRLAPRSAAVPVEFGDVELMVEHRGDEVWLVIPGELRLRAPRAQAMALVAALLKRPA